MRRRSISRCVAWLVSLTALGWWLLQLGGRFPAPPFGEPARWVAWVSAAGPVDTCFGLLRLTCLAAVVYLGGALLLALSAHVTGAQVLRRVSDVVSIALVKRIVNGTISMSVTAGAFVGGTSPVGATTPEAAASQSPQMLVMRAADTIIAGQEARLTMKALVQEPQLIMRTAPDLPGDGGELTMRADPPATAPAAEPLHSHAPASRVLRPGDHLWAVAEEQVALANDRPGTEGEISAYWERLVQLNRAELADPDNPDLVFPGQIIRLPAA